MSILADPVVTLEGVSIQNVSFSTLDLEVVIRVENPNPLGADLQECPFTVMYLKDGDNLQIGTGNTGSAKIPARSSTVIRILVTSHNTALPGAFAALIIKGGIEVTIEGTAVVTFLLISKPVRFSRTIPVSRAEIVGMVTGQKKD